MRKFINIILFSIIANLAFAQSDHEQLLSTYWQEAAPQKINVDLDKPFYMAGEDVHYHLSIQYLGLRPSEEIVYFALADINGKIVWQQKSQAANGVLTGIFTLPQNLEQGNYLLLAYTKYLHNFGSQYYFKKIIPVLSTIENIEEASFNIMFFSAGQYLVADVPNDIMWIASPDTTNLSVLIYENDEFHKAISQQAFTLEPEANMDYYAKIIYQGDTLSQKYKLPAVRKGVILNWENSEAGNQLVMRKSSGFDPGQATLMMANWNQIKYQENINWANKEKWIIPIPEISGINSIALINETGLIAHRLIFQHPDKKFTVEKLKSSYSSQEKVDIHFNFEKGLTGNLAISIHRLQHDYNPLSAFSADINAKDFSFIPNHSLTPQQQLLAYEWKWWNWSDIIKQKQALNVESAHERGLEISGRIENVPKGETISLSVPSGNPVFMTSQTTEDGKFYFSDLDFSGTRDFYVKIWGETPAKIQLDDLQKNIELPVIKLPQLIPDDNMRQYKNQKILIAKAENTFARYQKFDQNEDTHPGNYNDIVIDYDDYYKLDDYFSFPNMEDVMKEIVAGVILRDKRSGYKIRILDRRTKYYFKKEPLILLDGIPVAPEEIMKLNPVDVFGIAVTRPTGNYFDFGKLGKYGVLLVYTRQRKFRPSAGADMVRGEITGYGQKRKPEATQKPNKNLPDLRPLLHWETTELSALQDELSLEFYTSHDKATYQIRISGFTDEGERIFEAFNFNVN